MKHLLLLVLSVVGGQALAADTYYVDDHLVITLRTGQGNDYQILRTLATGTPVELVKVDGEYANVRTKDGVEGWVRKQYLTEEPVARDRLAAAEQKLDRLTSENERLKERAGSLSGDKKELEQQQSQLTTENERLRRELDHLQQVSAKPLELDSQNQEMRKRLLDLTEEMRLLKNENATLHDHSYRDWFLAGAGVLVAGMLLGLLMAKLRRRSSGWGDL